MSTSNYAEQIPVKPTRLSVRAELIIALVENLSRLTRGYLST